MSNKTIHPDWNKITDDELLQFRIRDLDVKINDSPLEKRVEHLYAELQSKGISFKPPCYLADEWLCPDQVPIIGIPFYLTQPRLIALEKRFMLEAEGSTENWCMKLLRHECGHALNYAYRLFARKDWRDLFGSFEAPYFNVTYDAKPYSKRYVIHLEDNYAQAHPDEDFAETFAVWLNPDSDWRNRYRGWPALEKLEYVEARIKAIDRTLPKIKKVTTPWAAQKMSSTLQSFYNRKQKYLGTEFPGFYDPGLRRIFSEESPPEKATQFLHRHKKIILQSVSLFVPQRKFDIDQLLEKLIARCKHLDLRLRKTPEATLLEVSSFVTAILGSIRRFNGVHEGK